ncbi:MAG: hypothetical protein ACKVRN_07535 [Pyrinomonadaceae bacterium]
MTRDIEQTKFVQEYIKLLTTLSTGAILIIAAFFDKVYKTPQHDWLITFSVVGLLVSVLSCVTVYSIMIYWSPIQMDSDEDVPWFPTWLAYVAIIGALGGFFFGIAALAVFTVINLG